MAHQNPPHHLREDDDDSLDPRAGKDLDEMLPAPDPQVVTNEPAKASLGSKLRDEEQARDLDAAVINSNHSLSSSTRRSITSSSGDVFTTPNPSVSSEISVQQTNSSRPNDTFINMPVTHPPASSPPEHNKLGFIVFPVEFLNAIISLAVSSKAKDNQVLIYVAVACSTLAFSISSTALVLLKKRPLMAKKMQKSAFLIGTFGFLGMMGVLLPSSIRWWFTISAFLVCVLMFAVANLIGREELTWLNSNESLRML